MNHSTSLPLYDAAAANAILDPDARANVVLRLLEARTTLNNDTRRDHSTDSNDPAERLDSFQPLDADFIDWPTRLLNDESELARIERTGAEFREQADDIVLLGIGGSSMGPRALFSALSDPYHNQRPRDARRNTPRFHFEGDNLDNNGLVALLDGLAHARDLPWRLLVTSKSGNTIETAIALRILLATLETRLNDSDQVARSIAVTTAADSSLNRLAAGMGCENIFTLPEAIGGRFSVLTAVGLLPAAILGLDIRKLLEGAAEMTRAFRETEPGHNPVIDHAATSITAEEQHGLSVRVLSVWTRELEHLGLWHDQLLAESLGKDGRGATPLTAVNTRDLHSRGQQHQDGRRDKLITNLLIDEPSTTSLVIPQRQDNFDGLNQLAGRTVRDVLDAAVTGTNRAYAEDARPTADIRMQRLDEFSIGAVLQMLMLAVTLEGYATGINPFGQPGVESYKRHMQNELGT